MSENQIIKASTGLAGRPCLKCCQKNTRQWRSGLTAIAQAFENYALSVQNGASLEEEAVFPIQDKGEVIGFLRPQFNPLGTPPVIAPQEEPIKAPPGGPVRPWGKGFFAIRAALAGGVAPTSAEVATIATATAAALRAVAQIAAQEKGVESCRDCIEPLIWSQKAPRVYETGRHRRRL